MGRLFGDKPYQQGTMLTPDPTPITKATNLATNAGYIHAAHHTYLPDHPYPYGAPISNQPARSAKPIVASNPWVTAFQSFFNNGKKFP